MKSVRDLGRELGPASGSGSKSRVGPRDGGEFRIPGGGEFEAVAAPRVRYGEAMGDVGVAPSSAPAVDEELPSSPEGPKVLPAELAAVSRSELEAVLRAGWAFVVKKTRSKELAEGLVPEMYLKLATTRRWDPKKMPLAQHFILSLKSELSNRLTSHASQREELAHDGFHREVRPGHVPSAEDLAVAPDSDARRARAQQDAKTVLELLRSRVRDHELMPGVLACKESGIDEPRRIAEKLGVPVQKVYRALDLLRYHLRQIREARGAGAREVEE
jgi:DNA-directed RNA polymerase specialized sigma24 family protein